MGLIRKTLAVGTVGVVRGSSKKQRNQKALIKEAKTANQIAAAHLQNDLRQQEVARAQAQQALAYAQAQTAYLQAQAARNIAGDMPPVSPVPALSQASSGWYNDPSDATLLRYFDGANWTGHTAPR
jgi:hypothetical protein